MIVSFKHKDLEELFKTGKTKKIDPKMQKRILRRLDALDAATKAEDMNIPGFDFHGLQGHVPKRYSVHINGPWCVTGTSKNPRLAAISCVAAILGSACTSMHTLKSIGGPAFLAPNILSCISSAIRGFLKVPYSIKIYNVSRETLLGI